MDDMNDVSRPIVRFVRVLSGSAAVGLLVGGVIAGVGGRLAMRLLAVTSDDRLRGRITDDDEVVGEITMGGTSGFIIFMALSGAVLAMLYVLVRRWLPSRVGGRAVAFAALFWAVQGQDIFRVRRFRLLRARSALARRVAVHADPAERWRADVFGRRAGARAMAERVASPVGERASPRADAPVLPDLDLRWGRRSCRVGHRTIPARHPRLAVEADVGRGCPSAHRHRALDRAAGVERGRKDPHLKRGRHVRLRVRPEVGALTEAICGWGRWLSFEPRGHGLLWPSRRAQE